MFSSSVKCTYSKQFSANIQIVVFSVREHPITYVYVDDEPISACPIEMGTGIGKYGNYFLIKHTQILSTTGTQFQDT